MYLSHTPPSSCWSRSPFQVASPLKCCSVLELVVELLLKVHLPHEPTTNWMEAQGARMDGSSHPQLPLGWRLPAVGPFFCCAVQPLLCLQPLTPFHQELLPSKIGKYNAGIRVREPAIIHGRWPCREIFLQAWIHRKCNLEESVILHGQPIHEGAAINLLAE